MKKFEMRPCRKCGTLNAVAVSRTNHGMHAVLSLLTLGLWLPIWLLASFEGGMAAHRERGFVTEKECSVCSPKQTFSEQMADAWRKGWQKGRQGRIDQSLDRITSS